MPGAETALRVPRPATSTSNAFEQYTWTTMTPQATDQELSPRPAAHLQCAIGCTTPDQISSSRSSSPGSKRGRDDAISGNDDDLAQIVRKLRATMISDSLQPCESDSEVESASSTEDEGTDFGWLCAVDKDVFAP